MPSVGVGIRRPTAAHACACPASALLIEVPILVRSRPSAAAPVREGDGWFIVIPREEVKTRAPIEFPVPDLIRSYLGVYLDIMHPA